jgi:hypothetical protein
LEEKRGEERRGEDIELEKEGKASNGVETLYTTAQ